MSALPIPAAVNGHAPPKKMAGLIATALAEPFHPSELKCKPGAVAGNRALAMPYLNARAVMDRLDAVLGVDGWKDEYRDLPDGSVVCKLSLRIAGRWVAKEDVGSPSEQPDAGDRRKAAYSDALKRAAVKFGVGRYLYRLPKTWLDYDPARRQFTQRLALPPEALPTPRLPVGGPS